MAMHLSIDQLLSVRDGAPVDAAVPEHLAACERCAAELERLRRTRAALRALPDVEPPPTAWEAIAARAAGARSRSRPLLLAGGLAAAIVVTVMVAGLLPRALRDDPATHAPQAVAARPSGTQAAPPATVVEPSVAERVAQSRELAWMLQALQPRRIERVSTAATIDVLEQRIQWVDYQLSLAPEAGLSAEQEARLWDERVHLLDSLVKVRYAQTRRAF